MGRSESNFSFQHKAGLNGRASAMTIEGQRLDSQPSQEEMLSDLKPLPGRGKSNEKMDLINAMMRSLSPNSR